MSIGSDYAAGMNIGINTRQVNQGPSFNPYSYLSEVASGNTARDVAMINAMGRGGGGGVSPKAILEDAQTTFLKRKEQELKNERAALDNERAALDIEKQEREMRDAQRKASIDRIAQAEAGVKTATDARVAADERNKGARKESAIQGFYTKDAGSIINFINQNGNQDANAVDVTWGDGSEIDDAGKVYIKFSNGNTVAFNSNEEAIEKLILPMAAIEQQAKGRPTEKDIMEDETKRGIATNKDAKEWGKNAQIKPLSNAERIRLRNSMAKELERPPTEQELNAEIVKIEGRVKAPNMAGRRGTPSEAGIKTGQSSGNSEKEIAAAAIARGQDPVLVKKRYKERTGKDYDSDTDTDKKDKDKTSDSEAE